MRSMRLAGYLIHTTPLARYGSPRAREDLRQAFLARCVHRSPEHTLVSPSGKPIDWLVDARAAMLDPALMDHLGALLWQHLEPMLPFQFACMEVAGIPLMTALQTQGVALGHNINGVILRKERKLYGRQRDLEGDLDSNPIIMLDDLLNSGSTIRRAAAMLAVRKRSIAHVVVLVDFERSNRTLVARGPVPSTFSLFTLRDLGLARSAHRAHTLPDPLEQVWYCAAEGAALFHVVPKSSPAVDDRAVYFGRDTGDLCALDQRTGDLLWQYHVETGTHKGIWSTPVISGDTVFFGAYDGGLYALDRLTGERRWRWIDADWIGSSPTVAPDLQLVFVGLEHALPNAKGGLVAVNALSGQQEWIHRTLRYVHGSPLYIQQLGMVVTGDNAGDLFALDARSGEVRWIFSADDSIKARPVYDPVNQTVVFGSFDGYVYAVDANDGALRWKHATDGPIYSIPMLIGGVVFIGSTDKHLYLIDAAGGTSLGRRRTGGKIFGSPVAVDGHLYFGSTDGVVYQLDLTNLEITGRHQSLERITNRLAYHSALKLLFLVSYDNSVTALRVSDVPRSSCDAECSL